MLDTTRLFARGAALALISVLGTGSAACARGVGGGRMGGDFGGRSFGNWGGDRSFAGRSLSHGDWGASRFDRGDEFGDRAAGWGDRGTAGRFDQGGLRDWQDRPQASRAGWRDQPIATDGGFGRLANQGSFDRYTHIGNNTYNFDRNTLVNNGNLVRNNFNHWGAFDGHWWGEHPGAWYGGWPAGYCYEPTSWAVMAPFLGMTTGMMMGMGMGALASGGGGNNTTTVVNPPVEYDYGTNVTYQGDNVYYGSQPVATAGGYYDQACNVAWAAPPPPAGQDSRANPDEWKPFGVFSLVQQGQTDSTTMFQIAVNKDGVIRGNYYNALTEETKPISGTIDKKAMRACWTIDGAKNVVYDTGVANLMEPQSPILVHFGKDKTQQMLLVRLQQSPGRQQPPQPS